MEVFKKNIEHYLDQLRDDHFKGIVLTTESRIDFHEMNITKPPLTRLAYEKLMFPLVFYFHKHSILLESFNNEISNLKSSGIFAMWKRQYRRRTISRKFLETDEAKPLNVMQITSFGGYWFGGIICSILCFVGEVFYWRFSQTIFDVFEMLLN